MPDETRRCPTCGATGPSDAPSCPSCGAALPASLPTSVAGGFAPPSAPSAPTPVTPPSPAHITELPAGPAAPTTSAAGPQTPTSPPHLAPSGRRAAAPDARGDVVHPRRPDGPVEPTPARRPLTPRESQMVHTIAGATGAPDDEVAELFALRQRQRTRPTCSVSLTVALVVLALAIGLAVWGAVIVEQHAGETTTTMHDYVPAERAVNDSVEVETAVPTSAPTYAAGDNPPGEADLRLLRSLLDGLMSVNEGLPKTVAEPMPAQAAQALVWGKKLRDWKDTYSASPQDERLAAAGVRFARALARWLRHPNSDGPYHGYLKAWAVWDKVDDTWETASD